MVGLVDILATTGYPLMASLCLFWSFYAVAEFRASKQPRLLVLSSAFFAYAIALSALSISTGVYTLIEFSQLTFFVRFFVLTTGILGWAFTILVVIHPNRDNNGRGNSSSSDFS